MTPEQRQQYNELEATAASLREEAEQARTQIDHLSKEKEEFNREISMSQVQVIYGHHIFLGLYNPKRYVCFLDKGALVGFTSTIGDC